VQTTVDTAALEYTLLRCRGLALAAKAKPARVSFVRDVLAAAEPGDALPADLALAISREEAAAVKRASRAGRSWRALDKKLSFAETPADERARRMLRFQGDGVGGVLEWWAAGDVDGDGMEDLLVHRVGGPDGGTLQVLDLFVLTRTTPKGVLRVIKP
jgi:hypothetical protein